MKIKKNIEILLNFILIFLIIAIAIYTVNLEKYLWIILITGVLLFFFLIFLFFKKNGKDIGSYLESREKLSKKRLLVLPVFLILFFLSEVEMVVIILFSLSITVIFLKEFLRD